MNINLFKATKMEFDTRYRKGNFGRSSLPKNPNETMKVLVTIAVGVLLGFFLGVSFPSLSLTRLNITTALIHDFVIIGDKSTTNFTQDNPSSTSRNQTTTDVSQGFHEWRKNMGCSLFLVRRPFEKFIRTQYNHAEIDVFYELPSLFFYVYILIWVPSNPKGAERLPPGIVASESDLYMRRLWGKPSEDLTSEPKYLVTFTVGYYQRNNIDLAVKKFSENFTILLFHYDGRTSEWDEFEWSKRAIHVSAIKQTKWWYAKRFLHPDIVAAYDYIFIWDEDLGVEHFDAEEYIKLVRKYDLEISQPGLEPNRGTTWQMTKRRGGQDVHKITEEKPGWCSDPHLPPCAAFVEIMAPVFSRDAWRCVWHMIQNDLVHGWGLDLALRRCVEPAHERIGVVDAQWIVHQTVPSLGNQGQAEEGKAPWQGVRQRCKNEWEMFRNRMENAEKTYYNSINSTEHT